MTGNLGQQRFLVLDDDSAVGLVMVFVAEKMGWEARAMTRPGEFLEQVDDWKPTHIALDLVMPEMDGVEVIGLLAERGCRARIIISSGVGGRVLDAAYRSAAGHGLDIIGVLSKPFLPSDLRALLRDNPALVSPVPALSESSVRLVGDDVTEAALTRALDNHEMRLVYQPKIDCASRSLAGFEALVRWHPPGGGIIMPDRFIPLAEESGLIDRLTAQVVEQGLSWFATSFPDSRVSLSLNISARSLASFGLADSVSEQCRRLAVDPARLIFELTETSAMGDPVASLDLLTRLRMKGFKLSIDDFGTGYSSMLQLVRLPFSEIKVDKSFVMTAVHSAESRTVTKSVVDLGHSLRLRTTAEGVENAETLAFLTGIGCDLAQGYFIARPMPGDAVGAWMTQWKAAAVHSDG